MYAIALTQSCIQCEYNLLSFKYLTNDCRGSVLVREFIDNHKNRMMLIEGRQKDYNFLINECKQLCEDKHYATDMVSSTISPSPTYLHYVIRSEKTSLIYT